MSEVTATGITMPTKSSKPMLTALPGSWPWAVAFLLSLSALGLYFYPALLAIIVIMANRFAKNRYDFLIQLTLLLGGFAITNVTVTIINTSYIVFMLGVFCAIILRKNRLFKKALAAWSVYAAILLAFALTSEESMRLQLRYVIAYSLFIYFTVPVALFAGKDFKFEDFIRSVLPYAIILSVFYIIDAFVLSGWVLIPHSHNWFDGNSAYYDLMWFPFSSSIIRKYPPGLYILSLLLLPLARSYRLPLWQWGIILLALASTQTFTVISGFMLLFLIFQSGLKRVCMYFGIGIVALVGIYYVDGTMSSVNDDFIEVSPLRIHSSVNQILDLREAVDDEDISKFGSGRIAQAIPKLELLYQLGYEWRGFGFLDRYETDNPKFIVENEYYLDKSESIEVATDIEITVLQIIVTIGYIGLAVHILFFLYTFWIVRKLKNSLYYASMLLLFSWFGLGGFEGLIFPMGVIMASLAFSITYLSNKQSLNENAS